MGMGGGGALTALGAVVSIVGDIKSAKEAGRVADIMRNLPGFNEVKPTEEQQKTIAGNMANFDEASKLADRTNTFNSDQILKMLRAAVPGYDAIMRGSSQLVQDRLAGKLGDDLTNSVWSNSASRALGLGLSGSGAGRNITARDLGMTSMGLQNQGFEMGQNLVKNMRPTMFDVSSMFLTPQQRIAYAFQNNENLYNSAMQQALGKTTGGVDAYYGKAFVKYGNQMMGTGMSMMQNSSGGAPTTGGGGGALQGGGYEPGGPNGGWNG